jgi:hypothetical protein
MDIVAVGRPNIRLHSLKSWMMKSDLKQVGDREATQTPPYDFHKGRNLANNSYFCSEN